jgi:signal transduction histidine kinase
MSTQPQQLTYAQPTLDRASLLLRSRSPRYVAGVLLLAAAYFGAAKVGQTLRYTASVSAIWPPAGLGIAALYLWGLRWWPGIFVGELLVNGELHLNDGSVPLGSLIGQQAGNMAEIVVGALLLRRLVGPRVALDRAEQVGGMLVALATATAISATVGMTSMWIGGVIESAELPKFWRTWWLGDTAGGLVVLPLALAWLPDPAAAWRRLRTYEGALLVASVVGLGVMALSIDEPATYIVFPALIWAAFRFGPPGAALAIAIAAGVAIGFTANEVEAFFKQPIDHRTLSTQVYIVFAALTTLFLSAVVSERERSLIELADARRREEERAIEERHRIARDLHDSVSQALFSTILHTRKAQRSLRQEGRPLSGTTARALDAIGELTRSAQTEMRSLIFQLGRDAALEEGLVEALATHAAGLGSRSGVTIDVEGPDGLELSGRAELELFGIGREALANVVKHAGASTAVVRVEAPPGRIVVEIRDDGCGFDSSVAHRGHFGLESMRSRAAELGGSLTITSTPGRGTMVRVDAPNETEGALNGD